jgi:hypothetical protein
MYQLPASNFTLEEFTLNMVVADSSEAFVSTNETTERHISDDSNVNLKYNLDKFKIFHSSGWKLVQYLLRYNSSISVENEPKFR